MYDPSCHKTAFQTASFGLAERTVAGNFVNLIGHLHTETDKLLKITVIKSQPARGSRRTIAHGSSRTARLRTRK